MELHSVGEVAARLGVAPTTIRMWGERYVPGAGRLSQGLARAASRLDEMAVEDAVVDALRSAGTVTVWDDVLRPLLVAAGEQWQRKGLGIEIEHLLTQAVSTAFVRHIADLPKITQVLVVATLRQRVRLRLPVHLLA